MTSESKGEDSVLGENLLRLRTAAGLSQAALAAEAGLSRVGYRNIERAGASPRPETLTRLAHALGVTVAELVSPVPQLTAVRFRAEKKMNSRPQILAQVARWLSSYVFLEELLGDSHPFPVDAIGLVGDTMRETAIDAACRTRSLMGLSEGEVVRDICGLLEDNGVKLYTPEIASKGFFGLSVGPQNGGPAVVVNTWDRITVERWIFTAAHELGHIVLHRNAFDVSHEDEEAHQEKQADIFASYFLMPPETFEKEWAEARGLHLVDAVFKMKAIFRVSWKTVVYRLAEQHSDPAKIWRHFYGAYKQKHGRSLGRIEEPAALGADEFNPSPSPALRSSDEPESLYPGNFAKDRLLRLVWRAKQEERISTGKAAEVLGCREQDLLEIESSWIG